MSQWALPASDVSCGDWTSTATAVNHTQVWTADGGDGPWVGACPAASATAGATLTISFPLEVCTVGSGGMFEWDWTTHTLTLGTHVAPQAGSTLTFIYSGLPLYGEIDEAQASLSDTDYIVSGATPVDDAYSFTMNTVKRPITGGIFLNVRAGLSSTASTDTYQSFNWDEVASSDSYVLQIGSATGLSDVYNKNVGSVLAYGMYLPAGTYYMRTVAYPSETVSTEVEVTVT